MTQGAIFDEMMMMDTLRQFLCLGFGLTAIYIASCVFYNLFLHPLRRFPGPLLMRATRVTYCYYVWRGTMAFDVRDLHRRYGDVVRIAPDELAFADPSAWKEIMGHKTGGGGGGANEAGAAELEFGKAERFYRPISDHPQDIITAPAPVHAMLRRQLSHGFSEQGLREQEPVIMKYVNFFINRLSETIGGHDGAAVAEGKHREERPVDLGLWYNHCTFDIIGELAFGESFGCLETGKLHPWVQTIFLAVRAGVALQLANYFSVLRRLLTAVLSTPAIQEKRIQHRELTMRKLLRRIELGEREGPRPDLMEGLLRKKSEWNLSLEELEANASILIVAGSETTATLLSGVTYLLLKNPEKMAALVREVRTAFRSEDDINLTSVTGLPYMLACLNEALRTYPPAPIGLPRTTPEGGATVLGEFIPEKTTVVIYHWAMYHNEKNFKNPFLFHPERFLGDPEYASDRREALQPFQVGPRKCLGRNLAYAEMKTILARLLWKFDLVLADDSQQWMERQKIFILWERGPLNVYLRPVVRS